MPRYMRLTAILAAIEVTAGVNAAPSGAANALLVSNCSITPLSASNVDRDLIRAWYGASEQLVGTAYVQVTFEVELAGSVAAGTPPAWGPLLRACGFAETIATGPARVEYSPITLNIPTLTIDYSVDGVTHKLLGARGTCELKMDLGGIPKLAFSFSGIDGGLAAVATPGTTLTAWRAPVVINDANSGDVTFGGALATGSITGGTPYAGKGLNLSLGNEVQFTPLTSGEGIDITKREVTGKVSLDLNAAEYVASMAAVKANTLSPLSYQFGAAVGNTVLIYGPAVQRLSPGYEDYNGRAMSTYDLRFVPQAGNDELRIVVK